MRSWQGQVGDNFRSLLERGALSSPGRQGDIIQRLSNTAMALNPGTRLAIYEVSAKIGEGGMGQVWQATDTQLHCQVALKILPDAFADDPDRLARFQREAQVLANLNHPGITQIYGIEKGEDTQALVLKLVGGPTLVGPIPKAASSRHQPLTSHPEPHPSANNNLFIFALLE